MNKNSQMVNFCQSYSFPDLKLVVLLLVRYALIFVRLFMSPVSPVFHTEATVSIGLLACMFQLCQAFVEFYVR